ncbi:hypothetical protein [Marinimicrobium sp. LS-A18]|uniref:hypothetical protein n=1 Tax=Marinimicrobium sp. LS-A18 TaxID=1381596 RepID=UPI00046350DE|nr:hypothetical protein [Marinimicrobium sp. LS-A18]
MIKVGDKILQMNKPNGTFIVFREYDSEDGFDKFLDLIHKKLGAEVTGIQQYPYSGMADISFPFGEATAIYQDGLGCAIRIGLNDDGLMKKIIEKCSSIR